MSQITTITELQSALADGKTTAVATVRRCLSRIHALSHELHTFISVHEENAIQEAVQMDTARASNSAPGPLCGVPLAIKDLIDVRGMRTTAASRVLENEPPATADAECIRRLRSAGAIVIGKTNLHEFAYGGSGVISTYGPTRNPWNLSRITGGSSSGSAAAVAAHWAYNAALGLGRTGTTPVEIKIASR